VEASIHECGERLKALPKPTYPESLPITAKKREIIELIRNNQVVIISGETGCGKSTQIPKMCLEAGRGIQGKIGCTQPRRIAATSIARRIAEEIADDVLASWRKGGSAAVGDEAISILKDLGITIVGDFIVSPDYDEARFDALEHYVSGRKIDIPIFAVLTPIPGTPLHAAVADRIALHDLDYYTFTNPVIPPLLGEKRFCERYAGLTKTFHDNAKL